MSIRPIDMQLTVPKVVDFSKQHQSDINKQVTDQNVFTNASIKQAEHKQTMVIETKESEANINKDGHNKQQYQKGKGKGDKEQQEQDAKKDKDKEATGLFDMRI